MNAALGDMLRSRLGNRFVFFLLAALIGALVGLSTLLLIQLILLVQWIGYGEASEIRFAQIVAARPAWQVLAVPCVGGLLVGLLMQLLPGKRYHGIADVMEACALKSARLPARSGIAAALAAAVSLGAGAPLGREGPAVHIGASISAWLATRLGLDHKQSLALLGCGAAAAVAVSFNAPVAAVIFALEVIVGYYTLRVFAPIVIAAMLAMVVRHSFVPDAPMFAVPPYALASLWELLPIALLGILGAFAARTLIFLTGSVGDGFERVRIPRWLRPAIAGIMIGAVALYLPAILSIGYEATLLALRGELEPSMLMILLVAKLVVVALALGSGFAGGVFGPAVFLGAMLGGTAWWAFTAMGLPLSEQGVYSVIGMAAVASAMLGAPISTIIIVFEVTQDYQITLGVMTAAAFASTTMQLGKHASFFRWQLARRNINLTDGRDVSLLVTRQVRSRISNRYAVVGPDVTAGELESLMGNDRQRLALFVDEEQCFLGSINLSGLISHAIAEGQGSLAMDAALPASYAISPNTNIVSAVQAMAEQDVEYVPVLDDTQPETPVLCGIVMKSDLLAEHYDALKRARQDEFGIT